MDWKMKWKIKRLSLYFILFLFLIEHWDLFERKYNWLFLNIQYEDTYGVLKVVLEFETQFTQRVGSPWSPQRPGRKHRGHSRRQQRHHQGRSPRCCTSPWPCSSGWRWRCRAASSWGGHTGSQTGPDPRHSGKSDRGSSNIHRNLEIILLDIVCWALNFETYRLHSHHSSHRGSASTSWLGC